MKYTKFTTLPVKARWKIVQESLGIEATGCKDKKTTKTIMKLQSDNGMTPNGCIDEQTYNLLNI